MTITHINPADLHASPAYSHATLVTSTRTLYIGGTVGEEPDGRIPGDTRAQTKQAVRNVLAILAEVNADQNNVVKLTITLAGNASLREVYAAAAESWGKQPTATTILQVKSLSRPDALVQIEAIAVV